MENRTNKVVKNYKFDMLQLLASYLIQFIGKTIFIYILGASYLGISGLFSNILSVLSVVELGVGSAISFSLYKPLKENDNNTVSALMKLYQKLYLIMGFAVLILGLLVMPFLNFIIKGGVDIKENLYLLYFLYLINTVSSYFLSYRTALITADQKAYKLIPIQLVSIVLSNIISYVLLILTKNYLVYLSSTICCTIIQMLVSYFYVGKCYPCLKEKGTKLPEETTKEIKKNVTSLMFRKIGGIVVLSTDNIIISAMVGIVAVGKYSNYYLIITILMLVISRIFSAAIPSIGNYSLEKDKKGLFNLFKSMETFNFILTAIASIAAFNIFNPFITMWIGEQYIFDSITVLLIVLNFYSLRMRDIFHTFVPALGLYWHERFKPFFEVFMNIGASILLGYFFGVAGILAGTLVSTIAPFFIEPFVMYKHGLDQKVSIHYKRKAMFLIVFAGTFALTTFLCNIINFSLIGNIIYRFLICAIVPTAIILLCYFKTNDFKLIVNRFKSIFKKKESVKENEK